MEKKINKSNHWAICKDCKGNGSKSKRIPKKAKLQYEKTLAQFVKNGDSAVSLLYPKGQRCVCLICKGSGLIPAIKNPLVEFENYPHIAIIGGGIGGIALAVACLHRSIPFTLYEKDSSFDARSQGYGLTLQQASAAMTGLGILYLEAGVYSTQHVVHKTTGEVIGEWGIRKWGRSITKAPVKRKNLHIARQALRLALLEQLQDSTAIKWNHQLLSYQECKNEVVTLTFKVKGELKSANANLVVGADGIRSKIRELLIGNNHTPLRYLDCMVILGICPLKNIKESDRSLLDSATVFQTANGCERIFMMPYSSDAIMWQLSFPISENLAKNLSSKGTKALKKEACERTLWHSPIPQIIAATNEAQISGYPVYDRALLSPILLEKAKNVTLIGDAAHPMSPFKGQGANQALLDALYLAREISKKGNIKSNWREIGIRKSILNDYESEMLARSSVKVERSAKAAILLHSDRVLQKRNGPRGK